MVKEEGGGGWKDVRKDCGEKHTTEEFSNRVSTMFKHVNAHICKKKKSIPFAFVGTFQSVKFAWVKKKL